MNLKNLEKGHICFRCQEVSTRIVGNFIETNCSYFDATRQQVDGNVSECEHFQGMMVDEKEAE